MMLCSKRRDFPPSTCVCLQLQKMIMHNTIHFSVGERAASLVKQRHPLFPRKREFSYITACRKPTALNQQWTILLLWNRIMEASCHDSVLQKESCIWVPRGGLQLFKSSLQQHIMMASWLRHKFIFSWVSGFKKMSFICEWMLKF